MTIENKENEENEENEENTSDYYNDIADNATNLTGLPLHNLLTMNPLYFWYNVGTNMMAQKENKNKKAIQDDE